MKKSFINLLAVILLAGTSFMANAQETKEAFKDSAILTEGFSSIVDEELRSEQDLEKTGAVYTLSGEELERMTVGNLLNTLQGRIPGLTVVTGSGEPGYDNPTLYVRGQSSWNIGGNRVLIYLDGFQVDLNALRALTPYEIESVSLLKDAAATAIYGLQGGAGVLSVKTKEGTNSTKNKITFHGKYGVRTPIDLPRVMNAYNYTSLYNQALNYDNLPAKYANPDLYKEKNDPFHPNVDWYDQILNSSSDIQDYNLSFRGGGTRAKYFVLLDYMNFKGIYKNASVIDKDFGTNAKYSKINLRANVDLKLSKRLSVKVFLSGITEDRKTPRGFTAGELFDNIMRIPAAAFPVKNPDESWGNNSIYKFNPVERLRQGGIYSSHTRTLQTGFTFNEKLDAILPGLALNGGISFDNYYVGVYQKHYTVPSYEITKDADDEPVRDGDGNIVYKKIGDISQDISDGGNEHWVRNSSFVGLNYLTKFNKNAITANLTGRREAYIHQGQQYPVHVQGLSADVTYDFDHRYVVNLSGAYQGAAGFEKGHRYGLFPAVGAAWVVSNESFLKENSTINFLKLRSSYGTTGNINEDFRFLYFQVAYGSDSWILGSNNESKGGMMEGRFANPNASWEEKTTFNFGIDMRLWKKLSLTVDVFNAKRTGIYEDPSANYPAFTGFSLPYVNGGVVNNHGFEAVVTYTGKAKDFEYYISGMASFARNEVKKKSEDIQPFDYLYEKGYRINQMRGLVYDGFYQESDFDADGSLKNGIASSSYTNAKPGDLKFVDQDGNGVINDYDKVPMEYAKLPEWSLGLNLGFKYKSFDFKAFIQGVMNRTVSLLDDAYNYTHPFVNGNNITEFSMNSWTPATATTATSPALSTLANENNNQPSNFWFRNGNFIKLRDVEIGYTLPQTGFLKKLDEVRVSVSGTNLFSLDQLDDLEPERLSMGYPLMKAVTFGLKLKF